MILKKILLIVALAVLLKPVFPVVEYVVQYDYISKVLCVNKAKPMLHCNGKCHLMKELAKAAETEKPLSSDKKSSVKQETELLFYFEVATLLPRTALQDSTKQVLDCYANLYQRLTVTAVFHPPTFA